MTKKKILFIDRDGTLIEEPDDNQVDSLDKLKLILGVIPALLTLQQAGYKFVMISNQDGMGTQDFPRVNFEKPHQTLMQLLASQGIKFEAEHICPHMPEDNCHCRKPRLGLVLDYLKNGDLDRNLSFVIGDRDTDMELANNMEIRGIQIGKKPYINWDNIVQQVIKLPRTAVVGRKTKETEVNVAVNLDAIAPIQINTGIGFFDHMLEQLAQHSGFSLQLTVTGDLHVDEHHTVEDTAIALGQALREALSDKKGIGRYGFVLPMDESLAQVTIDLCGRSYFVFKGSFLREQVGGLATELIPHFFRSFADSLGAAIHIEVKGENTHHMIEAIYKCVGRCLRQAVAKSGFSLPTTKGVL